MKKLFVFVPAILLVLFLINSFVLKEKEAVKVIKKPALVNSVLKSTDGGQTWQDISEGLPELTSSLKDSAWQKENNVVEAEGVLMATGQKGIKRSTDNGEHWQWVISEGGVGITVERIEGGFAAISYNTATNSRRVRISLDRGKTWQAIDEGLRPSMSISSIKQMGKYLICGHPDGIFRSSDMGKTWNKVHTGVELKCIPTFNSPYTEPRNVFRIYVSGNVLYAVARPVGC